MSSLALLAAGAAGDGDVAAAVTGGHGELFVQQFNGATLEPASEVANAVPAMAARLITAKLLVGSGARQLVEARGWGEAREQLPAAADALRLPESLRTLASKPVYARAPDARVSQAA
jgi:tRNA A37 threonylcarbamoyladenosine modification protein TsaB